MEGSFSLGSHFRQSFVKSGKSLVTRLYGLH